VSIEAKDHQAKGPVAQDVVTSACHDLQHRFTRRTTVAAVDLLEVIYAPSARLRCVRGGCDLQDLRGLLFEVESVRQAGQRIRLSQPQQLAAIRSLAVTSVTTRCDYASRRRSQGAYLPRSSLRSGPVLNCGVVDIDDLRRISGLQFVVIIRSMKVALFPGKHPKGRFS
jgi:hypothetical protein